MRARDVLVPLFAVALLSGCTVVAPEPRDTDAASVSDEANAPAPLHLDEGTVVATGELASVDGLTTGDVRIVAAPAGEFRLVLDDFSAPPGLPLSVNLSAEPFTEAAYCDGGFRIVVFDQFIAPAEMTSDLAFRDITFANPAFLDTLVLTVSDGSRPSTGCFYPVAATAPLTWTMPDMRPDLAVVDSGPTGGAAGPVAENGNGLASYDVVDGDVLDEIAARFGVTVIDLMYLNPVRDKGLQRVAFVGEILNLDKAGR